VASARGTLYVDGRPKSRGQVTTAGGAARPSAARARPVVPPPAGWTGRHHWPWSRDVDGAADATQAAAANTEGAGQHVPARSAGRRRSGRRRPGQRAEPPPVRGYRLETEPPNGAASGLPTVRDTSGPPCTVCS